MDNMNRFGALQEDESEEMNTILINMNLPGQREHVKINNAYKNAKVP